MPDLTERRVLKLIYFEYFSKYICRSISFPRYRSVSKQYFNFLGNFVSKICYFASKWLKLLEIIFSNFVWKIFECDEILNRIHIYVRFDSYSQIFELFRVINVSKRGFGIAICLIHNSTTRKTVTQHFENYSTKG